MVALIPPGTGQIRSRWHQSQHQYDGPATPEHDRPGRTCPQWDVHCAVSSRSPVARSDALLVSIRARAQVAAFPGRRTSRFRHAPELRRTRSCPGPLVQARGRALRPTHRNRDKPQGPHHVARSLVPGCRVLPSLVNPVDIGKVTRPCFGTQPVPLRDYPLP